MPTPQPTTEQIANFLIAFITIAAVAVGLLSMLIGKLAEWWVVAQMCYDDWRYDIMSRRAVRMSEREVVVTHGQQRATIDEQPIAKPTTQDNEKLSDNSIVPEEARDIIRMHAKAEALAALIKAGRITNKADGVEKVFTCSRSSKPDSVYQRALKILDPMLNDGPKFPPTTPEQEAKMRELGLS